MVVINFSMIFIVFGLDWIIWVRVNELNLNHSLATQPVVGWLKLFSSHMWVRQFESPHRGGQFQIRIEKKFIRIQSEFSSDPNNRIGLNEFGFQINFWIQIIFWIRINSDWYQIWTFFTILTKNLWNL